jgi:hypothetical protein
VYRSSRAIYSELAPFVADEDRAALLSLCIATLERVRSGRMAGRLATQGLFDAVAPVLPDNVRFRARALIDREIAHAVAAAELALELTGNRPVSR